MQSLKSRSSERTLHMPEPLGRRLRRYINTAHPNPLGLLFASGNGTPVDSEHILYRKLYPLLTGWGSSVAASMRFGHADSRTTLGVYTHVVPDSHRRAVDRVAEVLDVSGLTDGTTGQTIQ